MHTRARYKAIQAFRRMVVGKLVPLPRPHVSVPTMLSLTDAAIISTSLEAILYGEHQVQEDGLIILTSVDVQASRY